MTINWVAQAIGVVGVIAFIVSFQLKSNKLLLIMQIFANFMFCLQFILLGAYVGCISLLVLNFRSILLLLQARYKWAKWNGWLIIMILFLVGGTILSWDGVKSLLPFVAAAVGVAAYWSGNARAYRTSNLFCSCPCWLTYDAIVGSYAGMLNELIAITSIIVSIIRFGWKALGKDDFGTKE